MKKSIFAQYQQFLKKISRRQWLWVGVVFSLLIAYGVLFLVPRSITLSYAGDSCVRQLMFFPDALSSSSQEYSFYFKNELKIGTFAYAATDVCITPTTTPEAGRYTASVGLLGGRFMPKQFTVRTPDAPVVQANDFAGKKISTALPMKLPITAPDTTYTYSLRVADKTSVCTTKDEVLSCEVRSLDLQPNTEYTALLSRSFKDSKQTTLAEGRLKTLLPVVLKQASIEEAATLYDIRKDFQFTFDMPVKEAKTVLSYKTGDTQKRIALTPQANGDTITLTATEPLPRKTDFTLALEQVIAQNGSTLEAPIVRTFKTSGGPQPAGISVGTTGVAKNAQIIVTLDQPIKDSVDLAKFARVEGVPGLVAKRSATQLVYTLNGGLCQSFTLVLDKGVESGSNNEVSEGWRFDARTVCGSSAVIGYSVQGRPIIAYYFGNGSKTMLFTGGIHGEERSAQQTMQAWADYLMTDAYKIPADKRVVVIPNLNPDGIARGSRNNANNVNLGRNYPTVNWSASIDTASGTLPTGGGTEAGSEPETKAIMTITKQLMPRLEVSFHAQGRLVGANKVADSVSIGSMYASTVGYSTMYNNAEEIMGYSITGEYEEWMGEQYGIPAILIELPSRQGNYLTSQLNALMKLLAV